MEEAFRTTRLALGLHTYIIPIELRCCSNTHTTTRDCIMDGCELIWVASPQNKCRKSICIIFLNDAEHSFFGPLQFSPKVIIR